MKNRTIKLTEIQLKSKIRQLVREHLEEVQGQENRYTSDFSEPAQKLFQYAYKCDILKDSLQERARELDNVINEANKIISEIIGNDYPKNFNNDGDEVILTIPLQKKELEAIKGYLLQHQNEYSEMFQEYGDYEGKTMEEVVSNPEEMIWFLSEVVLQGKTEDLANYDLRQSSFSLNIGASSYSGFSIEITITCKTFDWDNLEALDRIGDI